MAATMVECVDVVLGRPVMELVGQPPIWKYYETKMYKLFNEANERLIKVLDKQVRYINILFDAQKYLKKRYDLTYLKI